MKSVEQFDREVMSWVGVTSHPHRFGGSEYRFGSAEIGHIHVGGTLDIPFSRMVRDALLADGLAEEHRWVPNSGWVTFQIRVEKDVEHAIWLMRLSYLRYALKRASDPQSTMERYAAEMHLTPRYQALIEALLPKVALA
jgi:hypothetical protein